MRKLVIASFLLIAAALVKPTPSLALDCDSGCAGASCYPKIGRHFLIYEQAVDTGRTSIAQRPASDPIGVGRDAGYGSGPLDWIIGPIHSLDFPISDVPVDSIFDPGQRWQFTGGIGHYDGKPRPSTHALPMIGSKAGMPRGTPAGPERAAYHLAAYHLNWDTIPRVESWITTDHGRFDARKAGNGLLPLPAALVAPQESIHPPRFGIRFARERGVRDEWFRLSAPEAFPKPGNWAILVAGLLGMCAVARPRIFSS